LLGRALAGLSFKLDEIAHHLGVTRERARQMVFDAKRQLAFRLFRAASGARSRRQHIKEIRRALP
jgi:DNA-directed RNA polymerase sigma subunit (sigma70/sigma32)